MIAVIKKNKYFIFTIASVLIVLFWYFNFQFWHFAVLNFLFFIFYFLFNSVWLGNLLTKFINLERGLKTIFGFFGFLFLIAFTMAVPIVLFKVVPIYLFILLFTLTLFISFLNHHYAGENKSASWPESDSRQEIEFPKILYFLFFVFYILAVAFLFRARTGKFILSPWTTISPFYLYFWMTIVFIIGLMIFSREKTAKILFFIVLASLLLHAYLPIVYQGGFGGDKWRHIGAEKLLMNGNIYSPALFGEKLRLKQFGKIKIPEVFIVGNKTSYSNMWGLSIALSWLLGLDIFLIDLILGFLLFSIFLPIFLFKFAQIFSDRKQFLLLTSFLPVCFFPLQIYGGITIPNTFGFLVFLFSLTSFLYLFFKKSISKKNKIIFFILLLVVLYFNYILYLFVFLGFALFFWLTKKILNSSGRKKKIFILFFCLIILFSFLIIPLLDSFNNFSHFKSIRIKEVFNALIDFGKRLLVSRAIFPRIFQMEQDNWLYMQTGRTMNRCVLMNLLPWSYILTPIFWLFFIYGILKLKKVSRPKYAYLLIVLLFIALVGQFIASYFMEGNHIFSKRLVVLISFLFILPFSWGIYSFVENKFLGQRAKILAVILFLSLLSGTVYASGPKMQRVTIDEIKAANYVWDNLKNKSGPYCVLANTWPLLAVEAVSGRQIITGGFPVYFEYRQPERVQLFQNMNKEPSIKYLEKSIKITGAKDCYFMTEKKWLFFERKEKIFNRINEILGNPKQIGDVFIWYYKK
ncbi:hypothetical protein J7K86_02400 [bacterium]|nr:hypothetical protein [bacterium]